MPNNTIIDFDDEKVRFDARISKSIKLMAERASLVNGTNLTNYISSLIVKDAPVVLENHRKMQVTSS